MNNIHGPKRLLHTLQCDLVPEIPITTNLLQKLETFLFLEKPLLKHICYYKTHSIMPLSKISAKCVYLNCSVMGGQKMKRVPSAINRYRSG